MKKIVLNIILVTLFINLDAQDVLNIEGRNITLEEFKSVFYKNNQDAEITREYLEDYIDLFINFKLKVIEAEELGLDTNQSFITELEGYRKQLARPYLKNNDFDNQMLLEAYDRIQQDINASHILISSPNVDNQEDSAYSKAVKIRNSIINGDISFSEAAKMYSDDKSAKSNGGNLGYFTAFMMVYDFETAAFTTPVGEVSMPTKTKYGYHLIQVNDRRPAVGKVKVAHIMFKTGYGADQTKINEAKGKANKAMELLQSGEDFADVAERFSEDRSTAVNGGSLPAFGVGKMVPEFEAAAFSLKHVGDFSEPFLTNYGWHIIKLIEQTPIRQFDEIKSDLKRMIEKDSRSELSQNALFEKLHNTYQVINKPSEYAAFRKKAAVKVEKGLFEVSIINKNTLLTIDGNSIFVDEFANYIVENQKLGSDIDVMYTDFVNQQLLAYEDSKLEDKYPEYKALFKEYKEGILLFDLTNAKVWSKAINDTLGLQTFFESNQSSYTWPDRVDATVYTCIDLSTAKKVRRQIYRKKRGSVTDDEIIKIINYQNPLALQVNSNKFSKYQNEYVDRINWKEGIANDIVLNDGSYILVDVHQVIPSCPKQLDEVRGKVISDYQNELEAKWLTELKSKYSIKVNMEVLYSLVQ